MRAHSWSELAGPDPDIWSNLDAVAKDFGFRYLIIKEKNVTNIWNFNLIRTKPDTVFFMRTGSEYGCSWCSCSVPIPLIIEICIRIQLISARIREAKKREKKYLVRITLKYSGKMWKCFHFALDSFFPFSRFHLEVNSTIEILISI